jgi:glucose-1-phosphate adenylyltransferase
VSHADISSTVAALVLAGGSSDNPLARNRAMPAIEIGSNLRLIDIPISNCIRSGVNKMFVLTQFNSNALNTHIHTCYPPGTFGNARQRGFVDVLTANQTPSSTDWYRGSADAVRNNLDNITEVFDGEPVDDLLVLSGQALYNMDYSQVVATHRQTGADITIVTHSIEEKDAGRRGLLRVNPDTGVVEKFAEKPGKAALQELSKGSRHSTEAQPFEASMGIYLFKRAVLEELLEDKNPGGTGRQDEHFGYDVIPHALRNGAKVVAHHHDGFWLDVSTLRNFFDINLSLAKRDAPLSIEEIHKGIVSRGSFCPPAIISHCELDNALVGEGCVLRHSTLRNVVLGSNAFIDAGCVLEDTILMGNSFYQNDAARAETRKAGEPVLGIGRNTQIQGAIIESNVSIGADVTIRNAAGVQEADRSETGGYIIQDGVILVLNGATILDGTRI